VRDVLSNIRLKLDGLCTSEADPRRTAAALALGVFLSFSPLLGLQIVFGLVAAFALRLSRVAVLLGLCANLPWIMLPWYALTTAGAATLLGTSTEVDIGARLGALLNVPIYRPAFWGHTSELVATFFWPFVIGPTLGALCLSLAAYTVGVRILMRHAVARPVGGPRESETRRGEAETRAPNQPVRNPQRARLLP
jgi:uncharacterized protein (DUF2062 family)